MSDDRNGKVVTVGVTLAFVGLAAAFLVDLWGHPSAIVEIPTVKSVFINTNTVRLSAGELIASEGDVSGMDCYACHDKAKPVVVHTNATGGIVVPDAHIDLVFSRMNCNGCHAADEKVEIVWTDEGKVVVPKAHQDMVVRHGKSSRNDHCFNCHESTNLVMLQTRDGRKLKLTESSLLCGSCHGPTYHDWEIGIHGRVGGFWDRKLGKADRKDCTSCHDPHRPAFPRLKPAPAPRYQRAGQFGHAENSKETN